MNFTTSGVCAKEIIFDIEDNKLKNVSYVGGCNGNLKGIGALVEGMDVNDVIFKLKGMTCKDKTTSCPDQLATALETYLNSK